MGKQIYKNLLPLLIIGLGYQSFLLATDHNQTKQSLAMKPDTFMENVVATTLDTEGKPVLRVVAPKIVHYPKYDTTDILAPLVTLYRPSPNPWFIHAAFAKTTHGINQVDLWDHVTLNHTVHDNMPITTVHTSSLTLFPEKQIATTDKPLTIIEPGSVTHATGMRADLKTDKIKLLSHAHGEYIATS